MAAYEWRPLASTPQADLESALAKFARYGGTRVLLDISAVADEAAEQASYDQLLQAYIETAARAGLSVGAVAGSPRWIDPELRYLTSVVVRYVARFNAAAPSRHRLAGLEFDLEPWATAAWPEQHVKLTGDLLDTVAQVRALPSARQFPVSFTLPFWLDGTAPPKAFTRDGLTMSPSQHVVRLLGAGSGPRHGITVLAYRDHTGGPDGSIAITRAEADFVAALGGRVAWVIGQEITRVEPPETTFAEEGPQALWDAMGELRATYRTRLGFAGFAINDLQALAAAL